MVKAILMVLLLAASTGTGQYTGPSRLGPFSIDVNKATRTRSLYRAVGRPRDPGADYFCYKGANGSYMYAVRMPHRSAEIGVVFVSVFPNCMGEVYTRTTFDFRGWRTPEGIGLGSSEHEVTKAYGPPPVRYKVDEDRYPGLIYNSTDPYGHPLPLPREIGSWILGRQEMVYGGGEDDLRAATFGLRDGHVIWIYASDSP